MSLRSRLALIATASFSSFTAVIDTSRAQSKMWELIGDTHADHLGCSSIFVPDVDGDGVVDILAGASNDLPSGNAGRAFLYSGATMSVLREFDGDAPGDAFGKIVADLGDVDGDGIRDFAIAAPKRSVAGQPLGAIFIVSGAGPVIRTIVSAKSTGQVGLDMSFLEDIDGDGVRDLFYNDWDGTAYTAVAVSGATGATIRTHSTSNPQFGFTLNRVGDVDADGVDDYAICEMTKAYFVHVYSGQTGSLLFDVAAYAPIVRPAGDVNQDGHADLILSYPGSGLVPVISGATGQALYTIKAGPTIGQAVSRTGDFDNDGYPDLVVTHVPGGGVDTDANIYSGINGALLAKCNTRTGGAQARSLDATADLDGDGVFDILAGIETARSFNTSPYWLEIGKVSVTSEATGAEMKEVYGTGFASQEGSGLTILDDLDGDGFREISVSVPGGTDDKSGRIVRVVAGSDGHELYRFTPVGTTLLDGELVRIGDVTGDGVGDLALGVASSTYPYGLVEFRSGSDGSLLGGYLPIGGNLAEIASAVDLSGTPLLAIGAVDYSTHATTVDVFELKTGSIVTSYSGHGSTGLSCVGDADQDGFVDWVVYDGANLNAFSGASAATLWTASLPSFVYRITYTGDLDGDGIGDLLVGGSFTSFKGSVRALSGSSGGQIFEIKYNSDSFGRSVVSLGDLNSDGVDDFAVDLPNFGSPGSIFIYSGATASLLDRIDGDGAGSSPYIAAMFPKQPWPDDTRIDPDSIPDLVVGDEYFDEYRGTVDAFRLDDLFLQIDPSTVAGGKSVSLATRGGPTGQFAGLFAVALDGIPINSFVAFGTFDATGAWSVGGTVPPSLSGHVVTFRSYAIGFQGNVVDSQDETLTGQ